MKPRKWILLPGLLGLLLPWACEDSPVNMKAQAPAAPAAAVSEEAPAVETPEQDEGPAGVRDMGRPCDRHTYLVPAGEETELAFSFVMGARDPGELSFDVNKSDVAQDGLEFSVAGVEVVPFDHPAWRIDATTVLAVPRPFTQVSPRGFTVFWDTGGTGLVMVHGRGLVGTGLMKREEVLARITGGEGTLEVKVPGSTETVRFPVELESSEATSYFARVTVSAIMPDRNDFHYGPGRPRHVSFRGNPTGNFRLTISRMSDTSEFQIIGPDIGPDIRPECYGVE
ncbi:MAG: hypothetical protein JRH05_14810 [Deltaproteobacteria bacterium]|nr:hypothetical protein [Deltaproteobacteria bacterium]